MVGWHHGFKGHELEQTPGDSERWGSLAPCSPRGLKELDTTWQLNNNIGAVGRNTQHGKWLPPRADNLRMFLYSFNIFYIRSGPSLAKT